MQHFNANKAAMAVGFTKNVSRELKLFVAASLAIGMAYSMIDATLNNFLHDRFALSGFQRSFLEFPREIPGLLVIVMSALLWFLCSRRLAGVAMLLSAAGSLLIGYASSTYPIMLIWLFMYSAGQHIFMPLSSTVGMELATEGKEGRRLGQLNAIRNLSAILGSFVVLIGFKYLGFSFKHTFLLAAISLVAAAVCFFGMKPDRIQAPALHFKLHKEYRLFYILSILYGSRKQLFITFAPWVLVTVFNQPTQTVATLLTIGGVIGILFQPLLGWATDHFGERFVLKSEAVLLVFVCAGYGFAQFMFSERTAFLVTCGCFLMDQMLMSVGMARSTYMKKIAKDPAHIQPALTMSVSIDHIFSITVALAGGLIWNHLGFQYVFLMGALIAMINFLVASRIQLPRKVMNHD